MQNWPTSGTDTDSEVTEEQKWEVVERIRSMSSQEVYNLLNELAASGWSIVLPTVYTKQYDCELPENEHPKTASYKLECQGNPKHTYCLDHRLYSRQCPKDGTLLTKVKV